MRELREDAVSVLEAEHACTRGLLAMLHRPLGHRARGRVIFVLVEDLLIHLQVEAEIFYPALWPGREWTVPGGTDPVRQALADLERFAARGADVLPIVRRIRSLHDADTAEEERHVFTHARRTLGARALAALAEQLRARRQELRASGLVHRAPHGG